MALQLQPPGQGPREGPNSYIEAPAGGCPPQRATGCCGGWNPRVQVFVGQQRAGKGPHLPHFLSQL